VYIDVVVLMRLMMMIMILFLKHNERVLEVWTAAFFFTFSTKRRSTL